MISRRAWSAVLLLALGGWEPFRSPDPEVEAGNKALADGNADDALAHYDKAAREGQVDKHGLAYDRGSAELAKAQAAKDPTERDRLAQRGLEDLKQAAQSSDPKLRAQANYNRGNTLLEGNKLEDAIDSYKKALRDQPGMDDARLNLELALKRRQKQEQQQQQGKGKGQGQGQGQGQGKPQQGQQGQGQPQQGQQGSGQQDPQQQPQPGQGQGQQDQKPQGQGKDPQDQQGQQKQHKDHTEPQNPQTATDGKLDDLESFSRNLQKDGARRRASGRPKDPDKDW